MASIREKTNKHGRRFYEIRVSRGREKAYLTKRWYPAENWSPRVVKRELTKAAAEFERQCHAGEVQSRAEQAAAARVQAQEAAKVKTLRQYAEGVFLPQRAVTLATRTVESYRWTLEKHVFPALGGFAIAEITPAQLSALLLAYQKTGAAHASVVRLYAVCKALFHAALLDETIDRNPMDRVPRPKPRKDELRRDGVETLTEAEVLRLLECLKAEPLVWRAFVSLLIETGVRRGEACALRWEDVDLSAGTISVNGSLGYTPQAGLYRSTPKSGHERTVSISPALSALLREQRAAQTLSAWVFTAPGSSEPVRPDSATAYLRRLGARNGFRHLHPHLLRHSFASIAITHGADVVSVSEILGHADTAITLRVYSHATEESRRRASQIFLESLQEGKAE